MSRQRPIYLADKVSGWPKGFVPTPAILRNLDQYSSELVNGEDGGEWAPASPIVIGPYGTPTITLGNASCVLSGDVETVKGNRLDASIDTPGLVLQGGAVPVLEAPITRDIVVPFTSAFYASATSTDGFNEFAHDLAPYAVDPLLCGMRGLKYIDDAGAGNSTVLTVPLPVRAQHRGATIGSVDFYFLIGGQFTAVPSTALGVRVGRVYSQFGSAFFDPLHTYPVGNYDGDGWLLDTAATLADFVANGEPRALSYVPDQFNTNLDPSTYSYCLQVHGASKWRDCVWLPAIVHLSNIVDMRQA